MAFSYPSSYKHARKNELYSADDFCLDELTIRWAARSKMPDFTKVSL